MERNVGKAPEDELNLALGPNFFDGFLATQIRKLIARNGWMRQMLLAVIFYLLKLRKLADYRLLFS